MSKNIEMIKATKTIKGEKFNKEFTKLAWKLLGKNKSGWTALPLEAQESRTISAVKPEANKTASVNKPDAPARPPL